LIACQAKKSFQFYTEGGGGWRWEGEKGRRSETNLGKDEKIRKSKAGMKANAGIYLSACTSFRSILLFTAAAYLITLLRLGKGLPDSILATTDWVVPIREAIPQRYRVSSKSSLPVEAKLDSAVVSKM